VCGNHEEDLAKVWIVAYGEYSNYAIEKIFRTKAAAEKYRSEMNQKAKREEVKFLEDLKLEHAHIDDPNFPLKFCIREIHCDSPDYYPNQIRMIQNKILEWAVYPNSHHYYVEEYVVYD
jgi:hypothetical protein